jgi:hypothetical protein
MRIEDYGLIGDLQAAGEVTSSSGRYRPGTLVLESEFVPLRATSRMPSVTSP